MQAAQTACNVSEDFTELRSGKLAIQRNGDLNMTLTVADPMTVVFKRVTSNPGERAAGNLTSRSVPVFLERRADGYKFSQPLILRGQLTDYQLPDANVNDDLPSAYKLGPSLFFDGNLVAKLVGAPQTPPHVGQIVTIMCNDAGESDGTQTTVRVCTLEKVEEADQLADLKAQEARERQETRDRPEPRDYATVIQRCMHLTFDSYQNGAAGTVTFGCIGESFVIEGRVADITDVDPKSKWPRALELYLGQFATYGYSLVAEVTAQPGKPPKVAQYGNVTMTCTFAGPTDRVVKFTGCVIQK